MTLLFGHQIHQSHRFNASSKTYRFQAIIGVSTTSYDPLGRIVNVRQVAAQEAEKFITEILKLQGDIEQILPPCSAYRYKGKPLWKHSMEGTLPNPLPVKSVKIHSIKSLQPHPTMVSLNEIRAEVLGDIGDFQRLNPEADFNFESIQEDWKDLREAQIQHFYRICLEATVGSGTYIRSLVYDIAKKLGIPAHAFRITRVRTFQDHAVAK
jgi:tRNA pseudouridine55 synthase